MIKDGNNKIYTFSTLKIVVGPTGKIHEGGGQFLSQTDAIFDRARTEGFNMPDIYIKRRMDILIRNLISAGIWAKFDMFECHCYGSIVLNNFKRINWKNPSGNLATINGGVVYDAYGWQGSAVNAYIDTGFNPALHGVNYTLNNAGRGALVFHSGTSTSLVIDGNNSTNNTLVNALTSGQRINTTGGLNTGINLGGTGLITINRTGSNDVMSTKGATQFNNTSASSVFPNENQWLFRTTSSYSDVGISFPVAYFCAWQ